MSQMQVPGRQSISRCSIALALLAILLIPAMPASAALDDVLYNRPYKMNALEDDPWAGGAWLATEAGLYFHPYEGGLQHFAYREGMPSINVRHVAVTPDRVWIGTAIGVAVLDKDLETFSYVRHAGQQLLSPIRTVHVAQSHVWLGSDVAGLFRVEPGSLQATPVANPINGSAFAHPIYGLGSIGNELFISATGYGLVQWDQATGAAKKHDDVYNQQKPYYGRILVDGNHVWIGSDGDGVLRLDRDSGQLREYASPSSVNALTVYEPLKVGATVWFPTHVGVSSYHVPTETWRDWNEVPAGFVQGSANDLALIGGKVYAASAHGHIARFDPGSQTWQEQHWWDKGRGINHNVVLTCGQAGSRLVFGTGGGGAQFYDPASGRWSKAGYEPDDQGKPRGIAIDAFAADDARYLFGHGNGISEKRLGSGEYAHYLVTDQQPLRGQNYVKDIEIDGGDAWIGTFASKQPRIRQTDPHTWNPGFLAKMDLATHSLRLYGREAGLADENITSVATGDGKVWIGTQATGLYVLDKAMNVIQHVWPPVGGAGVTDLLVAEKAVWFASPEGGLRSVDPSTMAVSSPALGVAAYSLLLHGSTLWVGTIFDGLHAYDLDADTTTSYRTGGPSDYLGYCLTMRDGILYMGTGWGVERLDVAKKVFLPQVAPLRGPTTPQASIAISWPTSGTIIDGWLVGRRMKDGGRATDGWRQVPVRSTQVHDERGVVAVDVEAPAPDDHPWKSHAWQVAARLGIQRPARVHVATAWPVAAVCRVCARQEFSQADMAVLVRIRGHGRGAVGEVRPPGRWVRVDHHVVHALARVPRPIGRRDDVLVARRPEVGEHRDGGRARSLGRIHHSLRREHRGASRVDREEGTAVAVGPAGIQHQGDRGGQGPRDMGLGRETITVIPGHVDETGHRCR